MRSVSRGRPGRQPMTDKRVQFARLVRQGVALQPSILQQGHRPLPRLGHRSTPGLAR